MHLKFENLSSNNMDIGSIDNSNYGIRITAVLITVLHWDDAELVLLIDPDKEGLGVIVVNTATLRPVTLHSGGNQVLVSRHKQEMVIDQLLSNIFGHAGEWVVCSGQVVSELLESTAHQLLNIKTLDASDAGGQTESLDAASNTNPR